jgi:hypothetical protein
MQAPRGWREGRWVLDEDPQEHLSGQHQDRSGLERLGRGGTGPPSMSATSPKTSGAGRVIRTISSPSSEGTNTLHETLLDTRVLTPDARRGPPLEAAPTMGGVTGGLCRLDRMPPEPDKRSGSHEDNYERQGPRQQDDL